MNYQVVGTVVSFLSMIFLAMPLTIIVSSFSKTYKDSKKGGGNQYNIVFLLICWYFSWIKSVYLEYPQVISLAFNNKYQILPHQGYPPANVYFLAVVLSRSQHFIHGVWRYQCKISTVDFINGCNSCSLIPSKTTIASISTDKMKM